jgi:arylsulfatase A-like enzyme
MRELATKIGIAAASAIALIALIEAFVVVRTLELFRLELWLGVTVHASAATTARVLEGLAYAALLGAWALAGRRRGIDVRLRVFGHLSLAALLVLAIYRTLTRYAGFASYPPFFVGLISLLVYVGTAGALFDLGDLGKRTRRLRWALIGAGLAGGAFVHAANYSVHPEIYMTLHLSMLLAEFALFFGAIALLQRAAMVSARRIAASLVATAALLATLLIARAGAFDTAARYVAARCMVGRTRIVRDPMTEKDEARAHPAHEPHAEQLFAKSTHLPSLPDAFDLTRYNVILILVEATRYDMTTLFDAKLGTTPRLAAFHANGAYSFERAYSGASGTLLSVSSWMSLTYPSAARVETWMRSWHGRLDASETTAAEVFASSGYRTAWIGHNYKYAFSHNILGFDQGFQHVELLPETGGAEAEKLDEKIADRGIAWLERAARDDARFFAWFFFDSPHSPYLPRSDVDVDGPAERVLLDRYRGNPELSEYLGEIMNADRHIGRVLDAIARLGLLDSSIVIVSSDHGEEFGEHGGEHHKSTVYGEAIHVPLLIRIPGLSGRTVAEPVSTVHVLPWLMLQGPKQMRAPVLDKLTSQVGPMLRATDGAVVTELIGQERMLVSLVKAGEKAAYDIGAGLLEVYDVEKDPREQRDLALRDAERRRHWQQRVERYLGARAAIRRFRVLPHERSRPTPAP